MTPPATKLQFFLYGLVGVFVAISLALIGAAGGYYLGQQSSVEPERTIVPVTPSPRVNSSPTPTSTSSAKLYQGRHSTFSFFYPASFSYEITDVEAGNEQIEQVLFTSQDPSTTLDRIILYVSSNPTGQLPEYPYDQPPTGEYILGSVPGIYLELPEGYSDGLQADPPPLTAVFVVHEGKTYKVTFEGATSIQDPLIQEVLKSFSFDSSQSIVPDGIACPMDAKICPDGSSVGRTGPNCEFAPCPGE
ncbi:MAG TPA: hypothetical protein VF209_04740 [Patescibacteria group bacterium]